MVSQDLWSSPGITQEPLIHHNSVSPALVLLTHASLGQAAKLVAIRLGLAVAVELVEDKEDHRVTAITNHRQHILSGVSRSEGSGCIMSVVGTLPSQLEVLLPKQFVGLEGELIDVPADPLICAIPPVGVAGDMAGEDVIAKEVANIKVSTSNSGTWNWCLFLSSIFNKRSFPFGTKLKSRLQS